MNNFKQDESKVIKMTNLTKRIKSIKPRRLVAGALMLSSLLGIISTPALAAPSEGGDVDVPYDVDVYSLYEPPCLYAEFVPTWDPSDVVYDDAGGGYWSVEIVLPTDEVSVSMTVELNFTYGQDENCNAVSPSGMVTADVQETAGDTLGTAQSVSVQCDTGCYADEITDITALFTFAGEGIYQGNITLSWVP
jgi:hypothetical protein